ncbi:MAG: RNA methyltransferase [Bacteroidetes bacterium]|nr:MAG: RNA methyltransferase [Bacteroidota bacterium]PTM14265.1 MAG: RNA methyltransferase [Bacteroidota bacterium]
MYFTGQIDLLCMALSKNTIKFIKALHLKKFRQKYNKFIAEGEKIVGELLLQDDYAVQEVYALAEWVEKNTSRGNFFSSPVHVVNEQDLKLISQFSTPNKVVAVVDKPAPRPQPDFGNDWSLYLDGLQDPGNVGTILRIADWFAIPRVVAGPGTVDLYNAKVLQATMGAFLRVNWIEMSLETVHTAYPQVPVWSAEMGGKDIFSLPIPAAGVLIIGNEGQGVSAAAQALVNQQVAIAAPVGSGAESLNAGVATGILCAAIRRQV